MSRGPRLPKNETPEAAYERLMRRVSVTATCWLWAGNKWSNGYARFWYQGHDWVGSRFVYWHKVGEFDPALQVCHHCDTPLCLRPDHLFVGTAKENVQDSLNKGRWMTQQRRDLYVRRRLPNAKLTPEKVRAIRAEYIKGSNKLAPTSLNGLALKYGVHPTTICHIVRGRFWKHVT